MLGGQRGIFPMLYYSYCCSWHYVRNLLHYLLISPPPRVASAIEEVVWGSLVLLVMFVADEAQMRCMHYSASA